VGTEEGKTSSTISSRGMGCGRPTPVESGRTFLRRLRHLSNAGPGRPLLGSGP
jgi:hypothetical protein